MTRCIFILLCLSLSLNVVAQEPTNAERVAEAAPPPSPEQIRAALRRYRDEASIDSLLRAVAELPELSPESIARLVRRGRLAALLPQLRGRARRGQVVDLREQVDDLRYSTDDSLTVELTLTWDLNRLVYGPNEVALARERARREEARAQRSRLVVSVYFERRRLQLERDLLGVVDVVHALRIEELGAMLDALSDGAFSRLSRL